MNMTPRQLNGLVLIGIGVVLLLTPQSLSGVIATSPPLVAAALTFLSPVGVIFFVLGLYRFGGKGKEE